MEVVWDLLKITIPLVVVMLTAYFTLKLSLSKIFKPGDEKENKTNTQEAPSELKSHKEVIMLRLQAYERLILFLERINPENMVMRLSKEAMLATDMHRQLLASIRTEYEHNVAQQLYISHQVWQFVVNAKDEVIKMINIAKNEMGNDENSIMLSKKIIIASGNSDLLHKSKLLLKDEAQKLF